MKVEVTDVELNEIIFSGEADDFLEQNDYDDEIEEFLNSLDEEENGTIVKYYSNQGIEFIFEKLEDTMED